MMVIISLSVKTIRSKILINNSSRLLWNSSDFERLPDMLRRRASLSTICSSAPSICPFLVSSECWHSKRFENSRLHEPCRMPIHESVNKNGHGMYYYYLIKLYHIVSEIAYVKQKPLHINKVNGSNFNSHKMSSSFQFQTSDGCILF